jgi:aminomethyltransferase
LKKTPLYESHIKLGGRIIEFGQWLLPVQYTGIIEEHEQVRKAAGLFDVSHMGEILVTGPDAASFIQKLVTNDIESAKDGQIVYSPMCYPSGGIVDDLLVYKFSREMYLLIVNANNTKKDYEWMLENTEGSVGVKNVSDDYAQLAIQGPKAQEILQKITSFPLSEIKFFRFTEGVLPDGISAIISRSGYTGEDGFEVYTSPENAVSLWDKLLEAGAGDGLVPAGLGARDTLRLEAALPLYGSEIDSDITPLEAGLERFVKLGKEGFIGRDALLNQHQSGVKRKLAGFEMLEKGIPRSRYPVQKDGKIIGHVTSGSFSPSLKKSIGLALIESAYAEEGAGLEIVIRGRPVRAVCVPVPFCFKKYQK